MKQLEAIVEVTLLVNKLFENDIEQSKKWMKEPNELLFGKSPIEVCVLDESEFLIKWLKDKLGIN